MAKLQRNHKRLIIIGIYLVIFFLLGWGIYSIFKPAGTCLDGKRNQDETGIDCGGVCKACEKNYQTQDLIVKETAFVSDSQGKYDVLARISNPNNQVGASYFAYIFKLKDAQGNVLTLRTGNNFILPVESKYIIETGLETDQEPKELEFQISTPKWEEFFGYEKPELNISSQRYDLISSGVGYSEAKGLLRNNSSFDFDTIKINVVLRNEIGKPIAFNRTEMRTVNAGEERDFRLLWPVHFPGSVQGVEMEAEANVFDSETFIRKYTNELQQFQQNK